MVKLKLNENYSNQFLTTLRGELFFRDWKEQNRPEYVEISEEIFRTDSELKQLVRMGILIKKEEKNNEQEKEQDKETIEEVQPKEDRPQKNKKKKMNDKVDEVIGEIGDVKQEKEEQEEQEE